VRASRLRATQSQREQTMAVTAKNAKKATKKAAKKAATKKARK